MCWCVGFYFYLSNYLSIFFSRLLSFYLIHTWNNAKYVYYVIKKTPEWTREFQGMPFIMNEVVYAKIKENQKMKITDETKNSYKMTWNIFIRINDCGKYNVGVKRMTKYSEFATPWAHECLLFLTWDFLD